MCWHKWWNKFLTIKTWINDLTDLKFFSNSTINFRTNFLKKTEQSYQDLMMKIGSLRLNQFVRLFGASERCFESESGREIKFSTRNISSRSDEDDGEKRMNHDTRQFKFRVSERIFRNREFCTSLSYESNEWIILCDDLLLRSYNLQVMLSNASHMIVVWLLNKI